LGCRGRAAPYSFGGEHALARRPSRTPQQEEVIVRIKGGFEDTRLEGELRGRVSAVLAVFRVRGITVSDAARKRILAEKDPARLERWLEKAIVATSVAEVLKEPKRAA
jgi:hypothetical protein